MTTLIELRNEVKRLVDDDSYGDTKITEYLNQSVKDIAGGVPVLWPNGNTTVLEPLEELYDIDTVTATSSAYKVVLPSDYQREVVFVAHEDGYELTRYTNMGDFRRSYPLLDQTGSVVAVCSKGGYLYYQGKPTTDTTLTVHFFRAPTAMSSNTDEPDGIPERFHRTLVVYDTCLRIFRELYEEDINKQGVIQAYERKRMTELVALASSQEADQGSVVFRCR